GNTNEEETTTDDGGSEPEVPLTASASPDPQLFTDSLTVSLSASDSGASIFYTIDGSTPTASSTLYESSVVITQTTTFKFFAFKEGEEQSEIYTVIYAKEDTDPGSPIALIEVNGPSWLETAAPYEDALTNYYAPHAVFFEGWGSGPDRDYIESYVWDFGDDSSTFSGFNAAHVYETPGTYNVTLTVTDRSGRTDTDSVQITVQARDGNTYYVDSAIGDDSYTGLCQTVGEENCGPWKTATQAFSYASTTTLYGPGDQILFKRGQTFEVMTNSSDAYGAYRISSGLYGIMFGAYGEGDKPLIQAIGDGGGTLIVNAFAKRRFFSFVDLKFDLTPVAGNPTLFFSASGGGTNYLWLRVDLEDFEQGWVLNSSLTDPMSNTFIVDSSTYNSEVVHLHCIATRLALLNNTFDYSGNHLAYAEVIKTGVIDNNIFSRPAYGRTALRISGNTLSHKASNIWVSDNVFQGWIDPRTGGVEYADGSQYNYSLVEFAPNTGDERFGEWLVFKDNIISSAQIFMRLGGWEHLSIKNNYFTTPDPTQAKKFQIGHSWELRPLSDINIVNNFFEFTDKVLLGHFAPMIYLRAYTGPEYEGKTTYEDITFARNVFRTSDNVFRFIQVPDDSAHYDILESDNNFVLWENDEDTIFIQGIDVPTNLTLAEWRALTGNDLSTQIHENYNLPVPGWTTVASATSGDTINVRYQDAKSMALETATAQGGSTSTIQLASSASSVDDFYKGKLLKITSGAGAEHSGSVQGGTTNTIILSSEASSVDDFYKDRLIRMSVGTQVRRIISYVGTTKTATVASDWDVPQSAWTYRIPAETRAITSYDGSTKTASVSWDWATQPDNTSVYEIIGQTTIDYVVLWVKYEDGEWQNTGLQESGVSGSFSYTPDQGSGTYYFATQAVDSEGNTSLPPTGFGSAQTVYIAPTS
ncbi:MAG: chitobiase/beta-hexosaminidase C-terminal domain-containing protein, partial [Candidatus Paceibacterota bacterium]